MGILLLLLFRLLLLQWLQVRPLLLLVLADADNAGQGVNGAGTTWRRFFDLINDGIIMVLLSRL